jgi:hypothetical protein
MTENTTIRNKARAALWAAGFALFAAALVLAAISFLPQARQAMNLAARDAVLARAVGARVDLGSGRSLPLVEYLGFAEWEAATGLHTEDVVGWNIYARPGGQWLVSFVVQTTGGSLRYDWNFQPAAKRMEPANPAAAKIKLVAAGD